jgi:hypothetical protein
MVGYGGDLCLALFLMFRKVGLFDWNQNTETAKMLFLVERQERKIGDKGLKDSPHCHPWSVA